MNLTEPFRYVVSLSLLGSVLAIGTLLIKLLFRQKLSATWHYYIWFVLILRLLIPFTPSSPFSALSFLPQYSTTIQLSQALSQPSVAPAPTPPDPNPIKTAPASLRSGGESTPISSSPSGSFGFNWTTTALVWLTGVLAILFYIFVVNALLLLKSRKQRIYDDKNITKILEGCRLSLNVRSKVSVVYDDSLKSPALFGLFRPKIIIAPEIIDKLSSEELRYVFLHELSHLKRRDLLVNSLITLVQVIYWFNPLIWYALLQMKQDCEMACDATALARVRPEEHKKYGQTIISLLQLLSKPHWAPGTIGFANKFNTRRIVMISSFKKTTLKWTIAALTLTLVVGCSSLSKPINLASTSQNQTSNSTSNHSQNSNTPSSQQIDGTSTSSNPATVNSNSGNNSSNSSSPASTAPADQSTVPASGFALDMMQLAKQGKVFNSDFSVKTTNIIMYP